MERVSDLSNVAVLQAILDDLPQCRAKIQFIVDKRKRVQLGGRRLRSELLDFYRGLTFESNFAGKAEERSDCIEKASDRSGDEATRIVSSEVQGVRVARREVKWRQLQIRKFIQLMQKSGRRLHGVLGGGIATDKQRRPKVR